MKISGEGLRGMVILSVFLALYAASAANATSSVGTDIAKIISVNHLGADQWVEIANEGTGSIDLTDWTLMNMENHTYSFPANFTLKACSTVKVHSGYGDNTSSDLWSSTLLWREMGDTAILKDAAGKIISEYKYPIAVSAPGNVAEISPLSLQNVSSISGTSMPFLPDYRPAYGAESGSLKSSSPVNLTGHTFICHGGPLNWAWTSGLE